MFMDYSESLLSLIQEDWVSYFFKLENKTKKHVDGRDTLGIMMRMMRSG